MTHATVDAKELASTVAWAMRAVPARAVTPVLAAIPLTVADGELVVSGYDRETSARATCQASGELGTVHVLGSMLSKITPQLSGDVQLALDGTRLLIRAGRDRYRLPIVPNDDYPSIPGMPPAVGDSHGFLDAVQRVAFASASAEAILNVKPELGGVYMVASGGVLMMRATDRYIMSRVTLPWGGEDFEVLVRGRVLGEYARAIGIGHVTLHVSDHGFGVTSGHYSATTLLMDGQYPASAFRMIDAGREASDNYDRGGHLIVPRAELSGAIKRASIALGKNEPLRLSLSAEEGCLISAQGEEGEATADAGGIYEGLPLESVNVTAAWLSAAVDSLATPYVVVGVQEGNGKELHVAGATDDAGQRQLDVEHLVIGRRA